MLFFLGPVSLLKVVGKEQLGLNSAKFVKGMKLNDLCCTLLVFTG